MGKLLNLQAVVAEEPYGVTLLVRIWRGPRLGNWPRLLYHLVVAPFHAGAWTSKMRNGITSGAT